MPEAMEGKVEFGLDMLHYAIMTSDGEKPTWEVPVPIPGAISLALEQQGEITKFYADNIVYYQVAANNGYQGDLTVAKFPEKMYEEVWKQTKVMTDNVLIEDANAEPANIALLFRIKSNKQDRLGVLYNCALTRPSVGSKTIEGTKEPNTQSATISAVPLKDGKIKAATLADTSEEVVANWFKAVYYPSAPAAAKAEGQV